MKCIYIILAFLTVTLSISAQNTKSSYDEFRKRITSEYQDFRKNILDNYATYLEGVWKDYQAFKAEKRIFGPKPKVVPKADKKPDKKPHSLPLKKIPDVKPYVPVVPKDTVPVKVEPVVIPKPIAPVVPKDTIPVKVEPVVVPKPIAPVVPKDTVPVKVEPVVNPKPSIDLCVFDFYGIEMKLPRVNPVRISSISDKSMATAWKEMCWNKVADIIPYLKNNITEYGLGDWFTMEYVMSYTKSLMLSASPSDRMILAHFLMANLGYDARLAIADNQVLVLLPFQQNVYGRMYTEIEGKRYYMIFDNLDKMGIDKGWLSTCVLPEDIDKGKLMNGIITTSIKMPETIMKDFTLTDGRLTIKGKVNATVMKMLDSYISVDIPYYATSNVITAFRQDILNQLRPQIAGKKEKDAVEALLSFAQHCFSYATDDEQFNREKYFFFEENFFYPKNDCEDRAIFFSFLVHNLLGLDVHLVQFPGHECTAVHFTDVELNGTYYTFNGKRYYICDPTYINAHIGQCMPQYQQTEPIIQQWY